MTSENLNIQLLVEGCRRNNRNSQRKLFEYFFPYAMNICLRYAKNREEAEEILNNGFLKVYRFIERYDSAYPFKVWLRKILINASVDYHRLHHKNPSFLALNPTMDIVDEDYEELSIDPQQDVLPILQKLSPVYRLVFNLYVIEEYKHDEIASMLNISSSASRSNLVRAKQKLRLLLKEEQNKWPTLKRKENKQ